MATFKDLLSHYGLLSKFEAIMASRQVDAQSLLGFYGSLAGALLHEVPALSDPRAVCRFHGARGGAPTGKRNGMYRHGEHTKEAVALRRQLSDLQRAARALLSRLA